mgnify:CR=1 FL=1
MIILIIFLIFVFLSLLYIKKNTLENYNAGTIVQLTAKDPQDTYLTNDASKYWYPQGTYNSGEYPNYPWPVYGSMRTKKSQRPIYIGQYPYYDALLNY